MTPGKKWFQGGAMDGLEIGQAVTAASPAAELTSRARPRLFVRGLHVTIAVLAIAAALVGWAWFQTDTELYIFTGYWLVTELIPGVIALALAGMFLLGYPQATVVGWVMLTCSLVLGVSVFLAGLFVTSYGQGWNTTGELFTASVTISGLGWFIAYLVLPQVYPHGLLSGRMWRILFAVSLVVVVVQLIFNSTFNWRSWHDLPLGFVDVDVALKVGLAAQGVCTAIVAVVLVERSRRGRGVVRQQVGLFAAVWAVMVVAWWVIVYQLGTESRVAAYLDASWLPLVVVIMAVTVIRYRLYDVRLVIRRAAIYTTMVLILTAVFAAVYLLVLWGLSSRVGQGYQWIAVTAAVTAAVVVVLAADPLQRRLRVELERWILGGRGDPLRSLARLDALVSAGSTDEQTVYRMIAQTVAEAVRAPGVVLAMHRGAGMDSVAISGAEPTDPVVVPLVHRGERLGELRVGRRTPGDRYGRADQALLDQLASQAAAAVYGLRRDRDIDVVRRQAIEAMAEQRMTLGRDLHDGLAPLLAGSALTADALRRGMPEDSADAEEAARLAARLRNAATEVRQIAHHLQPTGAGTGLTELIEDYVSSLTGPSVPSFTLELGDLADPALPATVELAMSRVALEAINNVVRHAHAEHAAVTLRVVDERLELIVSDDGLGIGQPYVSGLGITSMRSRIEAMRGSFDISPAVGYGSRLTARIPVSP